MNFDEHLKEQLKDPEFAAEFANARVESEKELFRCGVIKSMTTGSFNSKITYWDYESLKEQ